VYHQLAVRSNQSKPRHDEDGKMRKTQVEDVKKRDTKRMLQDEDYTARLKALET